MMMRLIIAVLGVISTASIHAAEWQLVHRSKDGTRLSSAESYELGDGTIRTFLRVEQQGRQGRPFAIYIKCSTKQVRDYKPGQLGSEFYLPWEYVSPDSPGEFAFNAFCPDANGKVKLKATRVVPAEDEAPSEAYISRVRARVRPNIVFTEDYFGTPACEVEILTSPDGTITSSSVVRSSGVKAWDDQVLKGIDKTEVVPRDTNGKIPKRILVTFMPRN